MKGRQKLWRRSSPQPSSHKDESDGGKPPKSPRRPDRSLDRDKSEPSEVKLRIVVMGAPRTGKTAIINQFLYNTFNPRYKRTIEEMHHGEFEVGGSRLCLQILDTSGENEFPAMRNLSIKNADAFILVYDLTEPSTFKVVEDLRDQILETRGTETEPMVIVANKSDIAEPQGEMSYVNETVVTIDWEHGFTEVSAYENRNVAETFKEVLRQAKVKYDLSPALRRKRRQSVPPPDGARGRRAGPGSSSAGSSPYRAGEPSSSQSHRSHHQREKQGGSKRSSCRLS